MAKKRKAMSLEERRARNREAARRRRERERKAYGDSGYVRGQQRVAYEPTPEEIEAKCIEFRKRHDQVLLAGCRPNPDRPSERVFSTEYLRYAMGQ